MVEPICITDYCHPKMIKVAVDNTPVHLGNFQDWKGIWYDLYVCQIDKFIKGYAVKSQAGIEIFDFKNTFWGMEGRDFVIATFVRAYKLNLFTDYMQDLAIKIALVEGKIDKYFNEEQ